MERFSDNIYASEQLRKALFDNLPVPVAIVSKEGEWIDFNDKVLEAFEYTRGELLKLRFDNVTAGKDVTPDWEEAKKVIAGEIPGYHMHKTYLTKRNEPFWALLIVQGVYSEQGDFEYFVSIFIPVKGFLANTKQVLRTLRHGKKAAGGMIFGVLFILYKVGLITWDELIGFFRSVFG